MDGRQVLLLAGTSLVALLVAAGVPAQAAGPAALTGKVSSAEEGAMEGVLVTAQKDGSTVAYTVVTNDKGEYAFPADKVDPGHYTLKIRATGYSGAGSADVAAGKAATADLKLAKVKNVFNQLTNAELLQSFPGSSNDKKVLLGCTNCHTLHRIAASVHDADEFLQVMGRMAKYSNNSYPLRIQSRVAESDAVTRFGAGAKKQAAYMASINRSAQDTWNYELKVMPRVKGKATQAVITEYQLPRHNIMPHDVITDDSGMVWFSDFGTNELGSMDPKTGKVTEHPYPRLRQGYPDGALNLEPDPQGNLWLALMFQGGVAKYDKKADKFTMYPVPDKFHTKATQQAMLAPMHDDVDNKVWMGDNGTRGLFRVDVKSGEFDFLAPFANFPKTEPHSTYGIYADHQNNLFFNDFSGENVGRIDAKTGELKMVATPTKKSRPRRGRLDDKDRLWFAEFYGDRAGMYDYKTNEVKEWKVPTEWTAPYDAVLDKEGMLWTAGMEADRIVRIDPNTGESVEYPLPHQTNIRRVFVDNHTTPPTFWVGNNEGGAIIKLELPK
jgi:streptogramin lyase